MRRYDFVSVLRPQRSGLLSPLLVLALIYSLICVPVAVASPPKDPPPCPPRLDIEGEARTEPVPSAADVMIDGERVRASVIEGELQRIIEGVRVRCRGDSCNHEQMQVALEEAISRHAPKTRSLLRKILVPLGRTIFILGYFGTVIGPGLLTYLVCMHAQEAVGVNIPDGLKSVLGVTVSGATGLLLGRPARFLEAMIGPPIEQATIKYLWNPSDGDSWGKILKALNEKERFTASQVYNQMVAALRPHIERGGQAVTQKDWRRAGHHYAVALRHSYHLFGGLHYYDPSTVSEARAYLYPYRVYETTVPGEKQLTEEDKINIIMATCLDMLLSTPPDQLRDGATVEELTRFAFGVMLRWLVVHPKDPVQRRTWWSMMPWMRWGRSTSQP